MRLSEIKSFKTKGPSTREFVVKKWDGHEPVQRVVTRSLLNHLTFL